jgi:hypothetical protein
MSRLVAAGRMATGHPVQRDARLQRDARRSVWRSRHAAYLFPKKDTVTM